MNTGESPRRFVHNSVDAVHYGADTLSVLNTSERAGVESSERALTINSCLYPHFSLCAGGAAEISRW